jgi:hypothetical protein
VGVNFVVAGDTYASSTRTLTIPARQLSAVATLTAKDDGIRRLTPMVVTISFGAPKFARDVVAPITISIVDTCATANVCTSVATCINSDSLSTPRCVCPTGYSGNGMIGEDADDGCTCGAGNLVDNNKATDFYATGPQYFRGWTSSGTWVNTLPATVSASTTAGSDSKVFRATSKTASITQDIACGCVTNTVLTLAADAYLANRDTLEMELSFLDSRGRANGGKEKETFSSQAGSWRTYSIKQKVPDKSAKARVTFTVTKESSSSTPQVFFDNVSLSRVAPRCKEVSDLPRGAFVKFGCDHNKGAGWPCRVACRDGFVRTNGHGDITTECIEEDGSAAYGGKGGKVKEIECQGWSADCYH